MAKASGYRTENALGLIVVGKTTYEVHAVGERRDWFALVGPRNAVYVVIMHEGRRPSVCTFTHTMRAARFEVTAEQMAPFTVTCS